MNNTKLKTWLESIGFKTAPNPMRSQYNECEWYAWRRIDQETVPCETNENKAGQLVIWPHEMTHDGMLHTGVEVEICGEAGGTWYKLRAYSIAAADLPAKLDSVESGLVAAWNAIPRPS